jgi:hypothetical protein
MLSNPTETLSLLNAGPAPSRETADTLVSIHKKASSLPRGLIYGLNATVRETFTDLKKLHDGLPPTDRLWTSDLPDTPRGYIRKVTTFARDDEVFTALRKRYVEEATHYCQRLIERLETELEGDDRTSRNSNRLYRSGTSATVMGLLNETVQGVQYLDEIWHAKEALSIGRS